MYKLPRKKLIAKSKEKRAGNQKTSFFSMHPALFTLHSSLFTPQSGFAPIALVVLLLFGIAAGTLLVQNGVNFLPRAETTVQVEVCNQNTATRILDCKDVSTQDVLKNKKAGERCNVLFSHCDIGGDRNNPKKNIEECRNGDATRNQFWCSVIPNEVSGDCSKAEIDQCKKDNSKTDRCYKNSAGERRCLYSADLEKKEACEKSCPNSNNRGCIILRGEQRCIYPDNETSCQNEGTNCTLITREGVHISDSPQKCNVGWNNYCRLLFNKGCTDREEGVPDCDGPPTPLSPTAAAPVTPPAGAPGAPPAANPPRTGNPPTTGGQPPANQPTTPATGCEEFKDGQSLSIPCFKIGVFSPEELAATEADAKEAVKRYVQFQDILTKIGNQISSEITENAQDKIKKAKANADECIEGK